MLEALDLQQLQQTVQGYLAKWGLDVVAAIAILVVGWMLAGWTRKAVRRTVDRMDAVDPTLRPLLARLASTVVLVLTVLAALHRLGIPTTSALTVLGAAGLAVGLALQGTLSNIASGAMILGFRPFGVGDVVEIGGEVLVIDEIGLFYTRAHAPDNIYTVLPNNQIASARIKNFTRNATRRIDLVIGIGYDDDIEKAIGIVREILDADERVLEEPAPLINVGELGDSSVNLFVRPWTKTPDFFATSLDLRKAIKLRFDAEGVSIPFPQRDVHMIGGATSGGKE